MFGALIAGIVVAAAGATAGLWGALKDDKNAREDLQGKMNRNEEEYQRAKQKAELEYKQAKEEAERNAARLDRQAAQMDVQADLTDKNLNQTEKTISDDFNAIIDQMYLSQEANTYNWNMQSMQAGKAEGASYAALGSTGVRAGSSLTDAVLMESATNASQLQFSQDSTRRNESNSLVSVLNNLAGNKLNIMQERIGADVTRENANYLRDDASYLRNSFANGGSNYNLYQNRLDTLKTNRDYNKQELDREWEKHSGWNSFANAFISFNTMGAKGFSTGYNIGGAFNNASAPSTGGYKTTV